MTKRYAGMGEQALFITLPSGSLGTHEGGVNTMVKSNPNQVAQLAGSLLRSDLTSASRDAGLSFAQVGLCNGARDYKCHVELINLIWKPRRRRLKI